MTIVILGAGDIAAAAARQLAAAQLASRGSADAFKELAKSKGASVKDIYWTLGRFDIVATVEAPDDGVMTALGLSIAQAGNIRTQTLRAFSAAEMGAILGKLG